MFSEVLDYLGRWTGTWGIQYRVSAMIWSVLDGRGSQVRGTYLKTQEPVKTS